MKFSRISRKPRKKHEALYKAPLHLRQKLVSAHLSKELRARLKKRSVAVRKGDKVRVMRGKFRKREGKVVRVDLSDSRVFIEGCVVKKQSGKEVLAPIHASNLLVLDLEKRTPRKKEKGGA